MKAITPALLSLALPLLGSALSGADLTSEGRDFFERKIRPVLVAECYDCHGAQKQKAGLRLDSRPGWQKGGDAGVVIVPGDPAKSSLLAAINHTDPDLKMPDKAPKLAAAVIADFERWIALGAPDPRDDATAEPAAKPNWSELFAARKVWWSLQPVKDHVPPAVADRAWSAHPVDRFLLAKMETKGLAPAVDADPRALLRRLAFILTGLPPTPGELERFATDFARDRAAALAAQADLLLASPRFGEHWARHWMDLVRYAETHGSEGDPAIPEAYRYRDYLIRAFNADVPLDQLIREHVAGDLLDRPRLNAAGFNESILGTAHFRFVEHGFQPVDTLDDQVKAVDSQIDVVSKAFQGLTISCARCHDHKFDAVSQRDYTALYGIFASVRPAQVTIDTAEVLEKNRSELDRLHAQIKTGLTKAWLVAAEMIASRLREQAARAGARESPLQAGDTPPPPGADRATPRAPWAGNFAAQKNRATPAAAPSAQRRARRSPPPRARVDSASPIRPPSPEPRRRATAAGRSAPRAACFFLRARQSHRRRRTTGPRRAHAPVASSGRRSGG